MKLQIDPAFLLSCEGLKPIHWRYLMQIVVSMGQDNWFTYKSCGISNGTFYRIITKLVDSGIIIKNGDYFCVNTKFAKWIDD